MFWLRKCFLRYFYYYLHETKTYSSDRFGKFEKLALWSVRIWLELSDLRQKKKLYVFKERVIYPSDQLKYMIDILTF